MKIYSVKDVKVGFMSPFIRSNDSLAIRDFKDAISDDHPTNALHKHPEDYELWCLGEFLQDSGVIKSEPKFLFSALSEDSHE